MAKQLEGVEFCGVGYHAGQILEAASAAYWLECAGAEDRLANRREEVRHQFEKLADLMGYRLVDATPDVPAAPLDRAMLKSATAMIPEDML